MRSSGEASVALEFRRRAELSREANEAAAAEAKRLREESAVARVGAAVQIGLYPIVTFQYSSTTLYQISLSYSVPVF